MERRSFFKKLVLGAAAVPAISLAKEPVVVQCRPGCKRVELPPGMGKINSMAMMGDYIFFAAETSVWRMHKDELK